jgi:hypothetical protein
MNNTNNPIKGSEEGEKIAAITSYDLMKMDRDQLLQYYKTLSPPDFKEMDGEYIGRTLDFGDAFGGGFWARLLAWIVLNTKGDWLGKAFSPSEKDQGIGYNVYRNSTKGIFRDDYMKTFMGPSYYHDGDAFHLDYSAYSKDTYVDEIRKVSERLYLGMVRNGAAKNPLKRIFPFILEGPFGTFVKTE